MFIIDFIKSNRRLLKLIRFCIVGGSAFLLSLLVFNILKTFIDFFRVHFVIASVIGDISGLIYGFYINKHWTYSKQKRPEERYFVKYMILYAITIGLNSLLLKFFIWSLTSYTVFDESFLQMIKDLFMNYAGNEPTTQNILENIAKISATAITTLLNFVGTNYIIFIHEGEIEEEGDEPEINY